MSSLRLAPIVVLGILITAVIGADDKKPYPSTRSEKVVEKIHGVEVADPFRWLEDADNSEVKEWTEKQNDYTRSVLDKLAVRDKIHDRLGSLLDIGTLGTPIPAKGHYFYLRRDGKQNQPVLYVREGLKGADKIVVDPNEMDKEGTTAMDWWFPSRDGKYVAYGLSHDGNERSTLHVRDVAAGKDTEDVIERTRACSVAWLPDDKGFYYTRYPRPGTIPKGEEQYHRHVYLHMLGDHPSKDVKVFGQGRPAEDWAEVKLSPDGHWLVVIEQQGWAKVEAFFKDAKDPNAKFQPLVEGIKAVYEVIPRNDVFYVRTNEKAPRYKIMKVNTAKPAHEDWTEVIPQDENDVLESIACVGDRIVGQYMHVATSRLLFFDATGQQLAETELPTLGTIAGLGGEWDGKELMYGFQSFTVPPTVYHFDFKTDKSELWAQVKTDIKLDDYEVEQVMVESKDTTKIPIFLVHKKGLKHNGNNPTLLTGYGGFNISMKPSFNSSQILFLEKGGLFVLANLRGGSEFGEEWHQTGMLDKKQNVFDDFISAAEALIGMKYTDSDHLAIMGRSNGGLLVGAALSQRPDLFRAVVCGVPLLDMVRYHKFLIARLWIPEYGSAEDAKQFQWLHAYSPYHHVKDGTKYPAVLFEAAASDSRVDPLHARKMAARLQAATASDQPVLLRIETNAGHGAGKPRAKVLEELTDTWSFLFWQLGIKA
jgi:prolyl oligopeptidase